MTVEAQSFEGAAVAYTASASDYLNRAIPVDCAPPSGSTFALATTTVSCSATADGQTTTSTFRITVVDRTPPAVMVPATKTVRTTSRTGAVANWTVSAVDIVDGPVAPGCAPKSGTRLPAGTTTVTCAAVDRHHNSGSATFLVNVVFVRAAQRSTLFSPLAGERVSGPPLLRWRAVPRARFYNVQVYRFGRKILTDWPTRTRFGMRRTWTFRGRTFRLKPGVYTWYVWPAFGRFTNHARYGKMLGQSSFRVV